MDISCAATPCSVILNSTCVFYEGGTLVYTGINSGDNLQTALQKIDAKFEDAGLGYVFVNGLIQTAPGVPVGLGGSLINDTTIGGNYRLTFAGSLESQAFVTTGGTSSQFVKGDGSLDNGSYQPAGNYISALTGDGTANGPGSAVFTLATVNTSIGTFGSSTRVPIVTVNGKGLITSITSTLIAVPSGVLIFTGDVTGSGITGSPVTLTLNPVNVDVYGPNTFLKFAVNAKGLVTSATLVTAFDIIGALGYTPVPTTRTISINGVTRDLSANRTWSVGTVTNVSVVAGTGISATVTNPTNTPNITITNTAPDRTVVLNSGANINVTGTYPNFTIAAVSNGGTVTSVGMTVPTGLTISGSPITTSGILALGLDSGYSIPTISNQNNWTTAYDHSIVSATVTGTANKLLTLNRQDGGTVTASWIDDGLTSVGLSMPSAFSVSNSPLTSNGTISVTGAGTNAEYIRGDGSLATFPSLAGYLTNVTASSPISSSGGTTPNISISLANTSTDGYLSSTDWNTFNNKSNTVGTVTNVAALTLGTAGTDINSSVVNSTTTPVITLNVPDASAINRGALTSADWSIFNNKQGTISTSAPITLTGTSVGITQSSISTDGYLSSTDWNIFNGKQPQLNGTGFVKALGTTISYDNSTYLTTISGIAAGGELSGTYPNPTLVNSAVIGKVLTGLNVVGGSITATDDILVAFGKVQNQINGLVGGLIYQGAWNASTNTPALTSSVGTNGYFYIVSVAGNTNLNGITDWQVGDWAIFHTPAWQKVDTTDSVTSVNGYIGAVSLTTADITEVTNLYYTDTRARNAISGGTGISYNSSTGVITNSAPDQTVVLSNGTAISISGTYPNFTINNTSPDQTVVLSDGTGISVTGSYPNFTITNTAPDQIVSLTGGGTTSISGTYPSFTITSNDAYVGTVTSIGLTSGTGISIGGSTSPITTSGSFTVTNTAPDQVVALSNGTGISISGTYPNFTITNTAPSSGGTVTGTGTTNTVPKFTSASTIGNSNIKDDGNAVTVNATAGGFGALQVGNYNGSILMNTSNTTGGLIFQNTSSSNKLWDFSSYGNDINFNESGVPTPVMTFKSGGNIGVNTITPSNKFEVNGTFKVVGVATFDSTLSDGTYSYTLPSATGTLALTSALSGYVPTSRTLTINGTTYDLSANRSWTINSMVYPSAGIAVSTGSAWSTSITDNSANWNTAYTNRITSLTTTGTSGAATLIANVLNIPNYSTDLSGYVPYTGATTNVNLGSFNLTSTDVTANGTLTLLGNIAASKTVSSGSPYSFVVTQNSTNATDTGDGALYVSHILSGVGSGTELVTRSFIFSSDNQRTGGSVLSNSRVLYLFSSTQSGTTTTNLDQVYIEGGAMVGTVTNNRGVLVKTMQGTNQAAFVATGLTSSNRVHLLLGNYTLPTGAWGIYSGLTDKSYLQGNLLLGSATDDTVNKLQVTGAAKITGQLTLGSTITNGTYTYTLPSATGTLALTSQLSGGTVTSVATAGTVSGLTLTGGTITTSGTITLGGTLSLTSGNITSGLGYTPVNKAGDTMTGVLTISQSTTQPLILSGSTHQYLYIASGATSESMTQYYNATAGNWYTGIRTSAGLAGITGYHIYSSIAGADVFGITTGGNLTIAGSYNGAGTGLTGTAASLSIGGSAGSATTSNSTYAINYNALGTATMNVSYGSSQVLRNENGSGGNYSYAPVLHLAASDTMWQIQGNYGGQTGLQWRSGYAGTWYSWWQILHSGNYTSYAPSLTGSGASGTWGISISGNAATASGQQSGANFTVNTGGAGYGLVGVYNPDLHQGFFAMGAAYTLSAAGGLANFYGVSWSYDGPGRQLNTGYGLQHCMAVANAGTVYTVIGTGIWTSGLIRANSYISAGTDLYLGGSSSGQVRMSTYNNRNLQVIGTGGADVGILGTVNGSSTFGFQLYGSGGNFGFLSSAWGSWAIRMNTSGDIVANGNISGSNINQSLLTSSSPSFNYVNLSVLAGDNYGALLYANNGTTYTQWRYAGSKNGWAGFSCGYSNVNGVMYDSSGNGGVYKESAGRWYSYYSIGNVCLGINDSATSSAYGLYVTRSIYTTGTLTQASDVRKKTDIVTIDNALEKVTQMRGVYFTKIGEEEKGRQTGVIAQEMNEILPEVVIHAKDVDEYSVAYGNAIGVLIEAIKEQQLQIEQLKQLIKQ